MPAESARDQESAPATDAVRRQRWIRAAAVVVGGLSLVPAGFCFFLASLMTFGLYSWQEAELDPDIWVPILGASLSLSAGPAVMALGWHRRRWLLITLATFLLVALVSSALTWLPLLGSQG
ncbi:hypothetical protein [Desertihabitans brevis]|uniref:hypothetical protein n=1 Tax=Desertihabitans brevis TaxID=2268447 RepID=UPI0011BD9CC5|nr:hypothetical protein [Desertihabitans brevis]